MPAPMENYKMCGVEIMPLNGLEEETVISAVLKMGKVMAPTYFHRRVEDQLSKSPGSVITIIHDHLKAPENHQTECQNAQKSTKSSVVGHDR